MQNTEKIITYAKQRHAGQMRAGNVPAWHHIVRVARLASAAIEQTGEGSEETQKDFFYAGIGHDLFEDTDASDDEVRELFGEIAYGWIQELTNSWGDDNVAPYVEKVLNGSEEARLIKLADLYDNISNVTYNISLLGLDWVHSYFLPVIEPMYSKIINSSFTQYSQTCDTLKPLVRYAHLILEKEVENFESK